MPSKKARMMLTLSHELYGVLVAWGKVQNVAASTLVASFLEQNKPIFQAMTVAIEAQKKGKEKEALKAMAVLTGAALSHLGEAMKGKKVH